MSSFHTVRIAAPRRARGAAIPFLRALATLALAPVMPASWPGRATADAQQPSAARAALHARIQSASPALEPFRAALPAAESRRGLARTGEPLTLDAEVEEVPGALQLHDAGTARLGVSRTLTPRALRSARVSLAARAIERARIALDAASRSLAVATDRLVATSAGTAAIAARLAAEDSLLVAAEAALRTRFAVGDARYVDVLRLRTERLRAQSQLQRARADERIARGQLLRLAAGAPDASRPDTAGVAALVDRVIAEERARVTSGALPPPPALDSLVARAGALRLAQQEVLQARAREALTRAAQRPAITPTLGLQRFGTDRGSTIGPTLGVSVTLPRTARGRTAAERTVAARDVALAEASARATTARVHAALAAAAERFGAARAQLAAFDAALLRGAREEREAALASYRTGDLSLLELLDFERALAQADITRMQGRIDAIDAWADLHLIALGADELPAFAEFAGDATHQENDR